MRKRKYLMGAVLGIVGALTMSSVASAAVLDQRLTANGFSKKQHSKKRGILGFAVAVDTTYDAAFTPAGNRTVLTFDRDFKFSRGNKPKCALGSIVGKDAAGARAACGNAQVGQGSAVVRTATGGFIFGTVTAFNGFPSGGNSTIYLHTDLKGVATKPILTGVLRGNLLDVDVPVTPGTVIEHFDTTINKQVVRKVVKKNKKTGKKQVFKKFYVSARCSRGAWTHSETTTFTDGTQKTSKWSQNCVKKNKKKRVFNK